MLCVCVGDTNKLSFKSKSMKYEDYLGAEEVFAALKVQGVQKGVENSCPILTQMELQLVGHVGYRGGNIVFPWRISYGMSIHITH